MENYKMSMTPDEAMTSLSSWITKHERLAWVPQTTAKDNAAGASKFSGHPLLLIEEDWPKCKCCHEPMELFLQLDLQSLPEELSEKHGSGLLQLFYCAGADNCEPGWEPFSNQCSLCRIIDTNDTHPAKINHNKFPSCTITGWEHIIDHPHPEEHNHLGIVIDYHFNDVPYQPTEMKCPELDLHFVGMKYVDALHDRVTSADGDKLGGWPHWVQGVEYPKCPECEAEMTFVMQLDSEDNVPFMFGDAGIGYITQCHTHKHIVAFGWACG